MYKCTGILESFSLVGGLFAFLQLHLLYTYHHNNHHRHHTIMYTRISYYNTHTHTHTHISSSFLTIIIYNHPVHGQRTVEGK